MANWALFTRRIERNEARMATRKRANRVHTRREDGTGEMNSLRAEWARRAVGTLQGDTGLTEADGLETAITDLLCDLMHLCDQGGLEFERGLSMARMHYISET